MQARTHSGTGWAVLVLLAWTGTAAGQALDWDTRAAETVAKYNAHQLAAAARGWEELSRAAEAFNAGDRRKALALHNLGVAYLDLQRPLDAIRALQRAAAHAGKPEATTLNLLAQAFAETGQLAKAERLLGEAAALLTGKPGEGAAVARVQLNRAKILLERGKPSESEEIVRSTLAGLPECGPACAAERIFLTNLLGGALLAQKRWSEAEEAYGEAVRASAAQWGEDAAATARARVNLAQAIRRGGRPAEAERMAAQSAAELAAKLGVEDPAYGAALKEQAGALRALKRGKEAAALERAAADILQRYMTQNQMGDTIDSEVLARRDRR